MSVRAPLSESAKADLQARIDAALLRNRAALARGDLVAAQTHWNEHVSLLEIQMGRVERVGDMTPEAS